MATPSAATHLNRGRLIPLFPTLGGQLYAIAREFGLPSIAGLYLYLLDDGCGTGTGASAGGPYIGDTVWRVLWSSYFAPNQPPIRGLPIAARIEWAVEPRRAPWWSTYLAEIRTVGARDRSTSASCSSQATTSSSTVLSRPAGAAISIEQCKRHVRSPLARTRRLPDSQLAPTPSASSSGTALVQQPSSSDDRTEAADDTVVDMTPSRDVRQPAKARPTRHPTERNLKGLLLAPNSLAAECSVDSSSLLSPFNLDTPQFASAPSSNPSPYLGSDASPKTTTSNTGDTSQPPPSHSDEQRSASSRVSVHSQPPSQSNSIHSDWLPPRDPQLQSLEQSIRSPPSQLTHESTRSSVSHPPPEHLEPMERKVPSTDQPIVPPSSSPIPPIPSTTRTAPTATVSLPPSDPSEWSLHPSHSLTDAEAAAVTSILSADPPPHALHAHLSSDHVPQESTPLKLRGEMWDVPTPPTPSGPLPGEETRCHRTMGSDTTDCTDRTDRIDPLTTIERALQLLSPETSKTEVGSVNEISAVNPPREFATESRPRALTADKAINQVTPTGLGLSIDVSTPRQQQHPSDDSSSLWTSLVRN